jgi:hypothetical protein
VSTDRTPQPDHAAAKVRTIRERLKMTRLYPAMQNTSRQHAVLNALIEASATSESRTHAYRAVVAFAPIQTVQQVSEMAWVTVARDRVDLRKVGRQPKQVEKSKREGDSVRGVETNHRPVLRERR